MKVTVKEGKANVNVTRTVIRMKKNYEIFTLCQQTQENSGSVLGKFSLRCPKKNVKIRLQKRLVKMSIKIMSRILSWTGLIDNGITYLPSGNQ